jgi:hypothetical protein
VATIDPDQFVTVTAVDQPRRCIEFSQTSRAACKGCKNKIAQGQLRFGTLVTIQDSSSYQWRCLDCLTARQASNVLLVAAGDATDIKAYCKLIARREAADGSLPDTFAEFVSALASDDKPKSAELLAKLKAFEPAVAPSKKATKGKATAEPKGKRGGADAAPAKKRAKRAKAKGSEDDEGDDDDDY